MTYTVRPQDAASIREEWLALLDAQPEPVPFLHPTWHAAWLDAFGDGAEPLTLAVRDGDALVGLAPLLRRDGTLSLAGSHKICDYMDLLASQDCAPGACASLVDALADEPWSEIELRGLREDSPTLPALAEAARAAGLAVERHDEAVAPRVDLPASWDGYLASLGRKERHELRRKLRRLEKAGEVELRVHTVPDAVEEQLPLLLRMMVDSRSDKASFMSEQMARFFHTMAGAMAREGLVRLYELDLDTKPVAFVLCFDYGNRLYMYNSGYDPEYAPLAVGLASKALCLRDAIETGRTAVDFLRGSEPYKYDLGGQDRAIYRLVMTRR